MNKVFGKIYCRIRAKHPDWSTERIEMAARYALRKGQKKMPNPPAVDKVEFEKILDAS